MRIGIIEFGQNKIIHKLRVELVKKLAMQHYVKEIDLRDENEKLTGLNYLVVLADSSSILGKKYDTEMQSFFRKHGTITAKYASFFTNERLFINKLFVKYMTILEKAGLIMDMTDTIKNEDEIEEITANIKTRITG